MHACLIPWSDQTWKTVLGKVDGEVSSEEYEKNTETRDRLVLFGDGAGAVVVEPRDDDDRGVIDCLLHTNGNEAERLWTKAGGSAFRPYFTPEMYDSGDVTPIVEGRKVYALAVTFMPQVTLEILERNGIRLRLRNTWYFPVSGGEWITLGGEQGRQWSLATAGVRQIRWEYTFYWDGRIVTDVVINNAGGREIAGVRITAPQPAAWSDGTRGPVAEVTRLAGDVARFSFLITPAGVQKRRWESDYLQPARLRVDVGEMDVVPGDAGGDGFDESQGCYRLRARAGRCRFAVVPWRRAVAGAVVRIAGPWGPAVTADSEGLALRRLVRLEDGSVLLVVPGPIRRTRWVEVTGPVGLFGDS